MSAQSPPLNTSSVRRNNRVISAPSFESQEPHHEEHTNAVYDSIASNIRYYDELRRGKPPHVSEAVVRSSSNGSSRQRAKSPARVPITRVVPTTDVYTPHSSHLDGSNLATHHMLSPRLSTSRNGDQQAATVAPTREPTRAPVSLPRAEGPGKAHSSPSPPRFAVSRESVEQRVRAQSNSPTTPLSTTVKPHLEGNIASPVADPSFERHNSASKRELKSMAPESPAASAAQSQESHGQVQRVVSRPRGPSSLNISTIRTPQEMADMTHVRAVNKLPAQGQARDAGTSVSSLISSTQRPPLATVAQLATDAPQGSRRLSDGTPTTPKVHHVVVHRMAASDSLASSVKGAHPPSQSQEGSSRGSPSTTKESTMSVGELKWYKQFKQTVTVTKQWREHAEALEKERDATVAEFELLNQHHTNLQGKCVDLVKLVAERDRHVKSLRDTIKELEAANEALRTTPRQPPASDLQHSQQQTIERLSEMLDEQHRSMAHKIEMGGVGEYGGSNTYPEGDPKAIQQLRTQCSLLATQLAGATDVHRRYKERAAEAEVRFLERQLVEERRRVHELFESLWHLTAPYHNVRTSSNPTKPTPLPVLFPRGVAALESEMNTLSFGDASSHVVGRSSPQRLQRGSEHHRLNNLYHMQCVDTTDNCESRLAAYFGVVEGLQQTLIGTRMHQAGAEQASSSMKEVMTEVLESIQEGAKALYKNTKLVSKVRDGLLTQQQLLSRQSRALKSHSRDHMEYPHTRGGVLIEPSESPNHRPRLYAPEGLPPRHTHTSSAVKPSRRHSSHMLDDSSDGIDSRGKGKDKRSKKGKSTKKHRRRSHHLQADLNGSNQLSSAYLSDGMESVEINPPAHVEDGEQYLANNVAEASGMAKETYELFMAYTDRVDTASDILKSCVQGLRAVLRTGPLNGGIDESGVSASDVGSEAHRSPSGRRHMVASVLDPTAAPQELLREIEADISSFKQSSSDVVARMSAALQRERLNHKQDCDGYLRRLCLAEDEYRNLLAAVSRYLPPGAEQQQAISNTMEDDPYTSHHDNHMSSHYQNTNHRNVDSLHNMSRNMAPSNHQSAYQHDSQHHPQSYYQPPYSHGNHGALTQAQYRSHSAPQQQQHYAEPVVEEEDEPRFDPIVPGTPISNSFHQNATPLASSRNTSTDFRKPISAVRQRRGSGAFAARQHGAVATVHRGRSLPTSSTHQMSTSRASTPGGSSHRYYYFNNTSDDLVGGGRAVPVDSGLRQEPRHQAPHPTEYRNNPAAVPLPHGDDLMERSESITTTNRQTPMTHSLPIPPSSRDAESHRTATASTANTRGSIPAPDMDDEQEDEVHKSQHNEDLYISVRNSDYSRSFLAGDDVRDVVESNTSGNSAMAIHLMLHGQGGEQNNTRHRGAAPRSRTSVTSGAYEEDYISVHHRHQRK